MSDGVKTAAGAVAARFAGGLTLRPEDAEALRQATGRDDAAQALRLLAADADSCLAAPLLALVYSPGPEDMRALEPVLDAANIDAEGASELEDAAARLVAAGGSRLRLPDGTFAALSPSEDDVRAYVRRLRPGATPPPELRARLPRFGPEAAAGLGVLLRHSRLAWSPARTFLLATLLDRMDASGTDSADGADGADGAPVLVAWAVRFLDMFPPDLSPRQALAARRRALEAGLRQAEFQERATAVGNFETRLSQGLRFGHVHGPDVRAELRLLDRASRLVLGLEGAALDRPPEERNLGQAEGPADLLRLLDGLPLE